MRLLLEVEGLNAFYGSAHVLQNVNFAVGKESVAVLGRNGMGKTTLCAAIMGFSPPRIDGLRPLRGHGARRQAVAQDRARPGSATSPRAGASSRR